MVVQCLDQNLYFAMNTVLYFSLRRRNIHTTEKSVYNNPFGSSLTFVAGFDPDCTINESSASELSKNILKEWSRAVKPKKVYLL